MSRNNSSKKKWSKVRQYFKTEDTHELRPDTGLLEEAVYPSSLANAVQFDDIFDFVDVLAVGYRVQDVDFCLDALGQAHSRRSHFLGENLRYKQSVSANEDLPDDLELVSTIDLKSYKTGTLRHQNYGRMIMAGCMIGIAHVPEDVVAYSKIETDYRGRVSQKTDMLSAFYLRKDLYSSKSSMFKLYRAFGFGLSADGIVGEANRATTQAIVDDLEKMILASGKQVIPAESFKDLLSNLVVHG